MVSDLRGRNLSGWTLSGAGVDPFLPSSTFYSLFIKHFGTMISSALKCWMAMVKVGVVGRGDAGFVA